MPVTITMDDETARQLASHARNHKLSVQDFSVQLLKDALNSSHNTKWENLNARRLDLIARKFTSGLSDEEAEELDRLQEASAAVCEPMDRQLLSKLSEYERRAGLDSQ